MSGFVKFFVALYNLYDASTKATAELVPLISPINLSEVLTHPRVITDVNVSSFKNKVAPGTVSAMDYTPPNTVPATTPAKPAPALPSQPSQPSQQVRAIGLFDFNAQDDTELGFKANDVITILDQSGECNFVLILALLLTLIVFQGGKENSMEKLDFYLRIMLKLFKVVICKRNFGGNKKPKLDKKNSIC